MAAGDIGSVIDTLEFDTSNCDKSEIILASGSVYAIAYTRGSAGWLKTATIHSDGQIDNAVIDSFNFDATGIHPTIIHISGNVYAIAYRGPGIHGYLKTVTINTNGQIDEPAIDTLVFDATLGDNPRMAHVANNVYAIAYMGSGGDGWIKTVTINDNGQIDNIVIDSFEYEPFHGQFPDITHVSGNIFAIVYQGPGAGDNEGYLDTVTINDNGQIDEPKLDSEHFETFFYESSIIKITDGIVAIAYEGTGNDGYLKTFGINGSGTITAIDTFEFAPGGTSTPRIIQVDGVIYAIIYRNNTDERGYITTVTINANGQIDEPLLDTLNFTNWCVKPYIVHVSGDTFAFTYIGNSLNEYDGYLKTVGIELPTKGASSALPIFAEMLG